jgi:hypothetical protein
MKIRPNRSGSAEFLVVFKQVLREGLFIENMDPRRLYNLRCSQLPYCPRSVALNYATRGLYQSMDMMKAYYVGVGTTVHHVIQRFLSLSGAFLADYECRECHKKYPLSHQHECCGFPTAYEEVEINYKGIVGHIDGIFKDRQGRYWIVDYKTTSLKSVDKRKASPGDNYIRQVKAYAYLLWKQHGVRVVGCMLIFLPRDNPKEPSIWELSMSERNWVEARKELLVDRQLHLDTMNAKSLDDFRKIFNSDCGNPYCEFCKKDVETLLWQIKKNLDKFPIKKNSQREITHA